MDPVENFCEISIPKEISYIVSDYIHAWTVCDKCGDVWDHTAFKEMGQKVDRCFYCRMADVNIYERWQNFNAERVEWCSYVIYDLDDCVLFDGHVQHPCYASIFCCDRLKCPVLEFQMAIAEFRWMLGVPPGLNCTGL